VLVCWSSVCTLPEKSTLHRLFCKQASLSFAKTRNQRPADQQQEFFQEKLRKNKDIGCWSLVLVFLLVFVQAGEDQQGIRSLEMFPDRA